MAKLPSRALETDVTSRPSAAELQLTPLLNQAPASETPACAWPAPPTARAKRDAARVMRARRIMVSPSGRGWTSRRWARRRVGRRANLLCRLQRAPGWEVTPGGAFVAAPRGVRVRSRDRHAICLGDGTRRTTSPSTSRSAEPAPSRLGTDRLSAGRAEL